MSEKEKKGIERSPVVAVMGHIDHGKSTLLDTIRESNVVAGEAGGITQHISSYEVEKDGKKITFLDTPGHAAFTCVRTRGAAVADIAILIVSAEDGVKPQTQEVIKCIEAQSIPFIVAINKIDSNRADANMTKQSLAEAGVYVEGYGGHVPAVEISAKEGTGVDNLLETINLMAELEELKGDPSINAKGVIIESHRDKNKGISATMIIKNGTLKKGQFVACGNTFAPVRFIENFLGEQKDEMSFSSPVNVVGWDDIPPVGEDFETFDTKKEAEEYIKLHVEALGVQEKFSMRTIADEDERKVLPIVIKADTDGSLEALKGEVAKLETEKVIPKVIMMSTGNITENDIKIASGTEEAVVLGFNTSIDASASTMSERLQIPIKTYSIIYELIDWLKEKIEEITPLETVDKEIGRAKVLKNFSSGKKSQVIGCRVLEGIIELGAQCKILRRGEEIGTAKIKELQQDKADSKTVTEGEFGCQVERSVEIAPGDELTPFKKVKE